MPPDLEPDLDEALKRSSHPRLLTLDFLKVCSPRIRRAYEYWDGKRQGRLMPARADIQPQEIPDLLPDIVLTEVLAEPPYLRYRLVGTRQVRMRGFDPTGRAVRGHHIGHHLEDDTWDEVLLNYRVVIERRSFVYDCNHFYGPQDDQGSLLRGQLFERGTLLLPLSTNGERVDMVFCVIEADEA